MADVSPDEDHGDGHVKVPIATFKEFVTFIAANDLWEDATRHLGGYGVDHIAMSAGQLDAIVRFVDEKGRSFAEDPQRKNLAVPRCPLICPRPKEPKFPKSPPVQ